MDYKNCNAYFTVEAALVMPMVMGVIMLLIYLAFFQYDRCLLEQDIGSLALKGRSLDVGEEEVLLYELQEAENEIYWKKYMVWTNGNVDVELERSNMKVIGRGELYFTFSGFLSKDIKDAWEMRAVYSNERIMPVNFIRMYRKIIGGK